MEYKKNNLPRCKRVWSLITFSVILQLTTALMLSAIPSVAHATLSLTQQTNDEATLQSPDGQLLLQLSHQEGSEAYLPASFVLKTKSGTLINEVQLGLKTQLTLFRELRLTALSKPEKIKVKYRMLTGKCSDIQQSGNELTCTFANAEGRMLQVIFRLFNDGLAFCYVLPAVSQEESVLTEMTSYQLAEGLNRWMQPYHADSYEDFYPCSQKSGKEGDLWGYPALIETAPEQFLLLSESDIRPGHCASRLKTISDNAYVVDLADARQNIAAGSEWRSPWRVMMAGPLSTLVRSTLVNDVAEPSVLNFKDSPWILPGSVAWIYWAHNHGSRDYTLVTDYIDLAAEMHWPYSLIDAEWDEMQNGGNIEDAFAYARNKGVGLMVWYNSSINWVSGGAPGPFYRLNDPQKREQEFAWLEKNGVKGVKIDFFKGDDESTLRFCRELLESAARHHLMVVFHGATIPRGWQRTFPNLMTIEAVYGAEWYNNNNRLTSRAACHNATLPFTRNIIGSMDYTPGTFTDSQHPHITTHCHELALSVLFESSLQHHPDRPSTYRNLPQEVKKYFTTLPTVWDEVKLLQGYPGTHVVLARRKGKCWYVAGINGTDQPLSLSFQPLQLNKKARHLQLFTDGEDGHSFVITAPNASTEPLIVPCLPRGGFVAVVW